MDLVLSPRGLGYLEFIQVSVLRILFFSRSRSLRQWVRLILTPAGFEGPLCLAVEKKWSILVRSSLQGRLSGVSSPCSSHRRVSIAAVVCSDPLQSRFLTRTTQCDGVDCRGSFCSFSDGTGMGWKLNKIYSAVCWLKMILRSFIRKRGIRTTTEYIHQACFLTIFP